MPTDAVQNARAVIAAIGVCRSVKALGNGSYEKVLGIVQRHPNATVKLKGVVEDFFVKKNGSGFILWMKKKGCEPERISYRKCDGKTSSMVRRLLLGRHSTIVCGVVLSRRLTRSGTGILQTSAHIVERTSRRKMVVKWTTRHILRPLSKSSFRRKCLSKSPPKPRNATTKYTATGS